MTDPATGMPAQLDPAPLLALLDLLEGRRYRFVTPTPASHARVVARPDRTVARRVEDVLGWSLPFDAALAEDEAIVLLDRAGALTPVDASGQRRALVRVSSLHGRLYLHSAYPTEAEDAVFFGPDSYRFADQIAAELERRGLYVSARLLDIGTGAGVGAIVAADHAPEAQVFATDINPAALLVAGVNAQAAGRRIELVEGEGMGDVPGLFDLVTANPPYIIDPAARAYRDGGGMHGAEIALRMTREGMARLAPGGRLILYTGSAIVDRRDVLAETLAADAKAAGLSLRYREIDPDVFGEELAEPFYADVDRIALVAAVITRGC